MLFLWHGKIREDVSPPVKTLKTPALSPDVLCKAFPARQETAERFRQSDIISSMAHGIIERLLAAVGGDTPGSWGSI
jgi:hypothetical protein